MLANTGTISFFLYGILILISIIAMVIVFKVIKNDTIPAEKIDKMIELFKYTIITTSIATVTLIVTDLFKERDYDKEEMAAFDKYIPYVIDTTSTIEKKINFCKFFSYVTPSGGLRDGWKNYTEFLESEKERYNEINLRVESLYNKETLTETDQIEIQNNEIQMQKILADVNAIVETSFLVVISNDSSLDEASPELKWAKENIDPNATIYKKGKWYMTVIPINTSLEDAKSLAKKTKNTSKRKAYVVSQKSLCETLEFSEKENCIICK